MTTIADLVVRLGIDAEGVEQSISKVAGKIDEGLTRIGDRAQSMGTKLSGMGDKTAKMGTKLTVGLTGPLLLGFSKAEGAATDLGEAVNATNQVYGDAASIIDNFAKSSATSVGLSERAFRAGVTPIGALLTNLGFANDEAAESTLRLGERAADMASVFNTDVEDALGAISSGLRGESEPLLAYGVRLNAASLEAKALAMGLGDSEGAIDDNAKAQAAMALIMEQSESVAGDFTNTIDSNANASRVMAAEAENAAAAFGENLIPIKQEAIGVAGKLLDKFNALSPEMQKNAVTAGLLGMALGPVLAVTGNLMKVMGGLLKVTGATVKFLPRLASGATTAASGVGRFAAATARGAVSAGAAMGRLAVAAAHTAAQVVSAFVRMAVSAAQAAARFVAQIAIQVAQWVVLGVQSMLQAARVALAWLISMGPIILVAAAIIAFVALVIANWDTIVAMTKASFGLVLGAIKSVINWVKSNWPLLLAILTGPFGLAVLAIVKHWDKIKGAATAAKDWVVARLNDLVSFVTGLPGRIASAARGLFDGFRDAFRAALNWIIGRWNGLSFTLPSFSAFGKTVGGGTISTPNIPQLAEGAIVRSTPGGTLANIGEGRDDEAVIPLPRGMRSMEVGADQTVIHVAGSVISERELLKIVEDGQASGRIRRRAA